MSAARISAMIFCCKLLALMLLLTGGLGKYVDVDAAETAKYPGSFNEARPHPNYSYSLGVLELALSKLNSPQVLEPIRTTEPQARILNQMRDSAVFDVFWASTTAELERDLLPIRICLMKGLNGWRVPIVAKGQQNLLADVKTLADLQAFSAGLGFGWTDVDIFKAAGLKVERSYSIEKIYGMLDAGRFDYFPRGLQEVWQELDDAKDSKFIADSHLIIHYPSPIYFFVRRERPELAHEIQKGLEIAIKDGSFDKFFYKFYKSNLLRTDLTHRRIIEIPNPLLTPETPLDRHKLWFSIKDLSTL